MSVHTEQRDIAIGEFFKELTVIVKTVKEILDIMIADHQQQAEERERSPRRRPMR